MESQPSPPSSKGTLRTPLGEPGEPLEGQALKSSCSSAFSVSLGDSEGAQPMGQPESAAAPLAAETFLLLMADDDPEDCLLVAEAIQENRFPHQVHFVHDGEELLDYLYHRGRYLQSRPRLPDLLLLDLNMPKLDGREALRRIKTDQRLRSLPVLILTTSRQEDDVQRCYQMGAASFLTKPVTYRGWILLIRDLCTYWFERVRLPGGAKR